MFCTPELDRAAHAACRPSKFNRYSRAVQPVPAIKWTARFAPLPLGRLFLQQKSAAVGEWTLISAVRQTASAGLHRDRHANAG